MDFVKGVANKIEERGFLQSGEVRWFSWPMVAGQVGDEVEEKVVEGGEVEVFVGRKKEGKK